MRRVTLIVEYDETRGQWRCHFEATHRDSPSVPAVYWRVGPNEWRTPTGLHLDPVFGGTADNLLDFA